MNDKYERIRYMTRPQYADLPPMPIRDRAAQFSPFAAVVGYDDAVAETARLTDDRVELTGDAAYELDLSLEKLRSQISKRPSIKAVYFLPDRKKAGGRYVEKTGHVRRIDEVEGVLFFADGDKVAISEIRSISFSADEV